MYLQNAEALLKTKALSIHIRSEQALNRLFSTTNSGLKPEVPGEGLRALRCREFIRRELGRKTQSGLS
jgi:hypothetical protein